MFRRIASALGVCAALAVTASALVSAEPQKPVRKTIVFRQTPPVPSTFKQLWQRSTVVIEGIVEQATILPEGQHNSVDETRFRVRVLALYKHDGHVKSDFVNVDMVGAMRDRGQFIEVTEQRGVPLLALNQHVLLFLTRRVSAPSYELATRTHDSVFVTDGQLVTTQGRHAAADELSRLSYAQLTAQLTNRGGVK